MPINVICPNAGCQKRFTVPDNAAGKSATCTNCGTKIAIPAEGGEFEEPAPAKKRPKADFDTDDDRDDEPKSRKKGRKGRDDDDFDDAPPVRRRAPSVPGENPFVDFLMFRRMITPWIVMILYWVSVVLYIFGGLFSMIFGGGFASVLYGMALMFLGPFVSRIFCETIILAFRINETLTDIRNNTKKE